MTSPVSIGDAVLLSQIALKLGQAFTTGRKSAPAEFREVENQLYSISTALSSLDDAYKSADRSSGIRAPVIASLRRNGRSNGEDALKSMLEGCAERLKHLEDIVEKYSTVAQSKTSGGPILRRWTTELKRNWKKVQWTTEGGDLATLRSHLTVHINSLNLVLGVMNHALTGRVEDQVDQVSTMLKEIHTWFIDNLQGVTAGPSQIQRTQTTTLAEAPLVGIRFELYAESNTTADALCTSASLHPKWDEKRHASGSREDSSPKQVFQCHCSGQPGQSTPHDAVLSALGLSPLSFALRVAGSKKTWMVYKASDRQTNRLTTLTIRNVPANKIDEFERSFIDTVGLRSAKAMLRRNMGTMLAYTTPGRIDAVPETRVLNMIGDLQGTQKQIEKVTFTIGSQSYSRAAIETVQLLHYRTLREESAAIVDSVEHPEALAPMATAELVVFYSASDNDVTRVIMHLTHKTIVRYQAGETAVLLGGIDCTGLNPDDEGSLLSNVNVTIHFATPEAATQFKNKILEMRVELFVMSLGTPGPDDRVALRLQVGGVHTEAVDLPDSTLYIVQSETSKRLRLIIVSDDKGTILSQELAEDVFTEPSGRPSFTSPTYVVQIVGSGAREIHLYDKGFQYFDFSDVQVERMFGLGIAAVLGQPNAPAQIAAEESRGRRLVSNRSHR